MVPGEWWVLDFRRAGGHPCRVSPAPAELLDGDLLEIRPGRYGVGGAVLRALGQQSLNPIAERRVQVGLTVSGLGGRSWTGL
jgi:hypothetical protein